MPAARSISRVRSRAPNRPLPKPAWSWSRPIGSRAEPTESRARLFRLEVQAEGQGIAQHAAVVVLGGPQVIDRNPGGGQARTARIALIRGAVLGEGEGMPRPHPHVLNQHL